MESPANLESRIAFIHDLARRGGFGPTLAARDAALIIELALRELLRCHLGELPPDDRRKVEQAIANTAKSGRGKEVGTFTLGQLVGVIREGKFFDRWSKATGTPLAELPLIDLNALSKFRNEDLTHVESFERLTDPSAQVSLPTAQFLLHYAGMLITTFDIISLEGMPPAPDAALLGNGDSGKHSPQLKANDLFDVQFVNEQGQNTYCKNDDPALRFHDLSWFKVHLHFKLRVKQRIVLTNIGLNYPHVVAWPGEQQIMLDGDRQATDSRFGLGRHKAVEAESIIDVLMARTFHCNADKTWDGDYQRVEAKLEFTIRGIDGFHGLVIRGELKPGGCVSDVGMELIRQ